MGVELYGKRQLLAYADNVNLLGDNVDTINEDSDTSTVASN
jgi:hypothetical protein